MKWILQLSLLLTISCARVAVKPPVEPTEPPTEVVVTPPGTESPAPVEENYIELWEGLTTSKAWLSEVKRVAECILRQEEFYQDIAAVKKFTSTDMTPAQVAQEMRKRPKAIISVYTSKYPWSDVTAYRNDGSNIIYFNTRMHAGAPTLVHEYSHVIGFGHFDENDWQSVPYQLDVIAEKYVERCER